MHKKLAHPYEIQNTFVIIIINGLLTLFSICYYYAPRHRYVKNYTNQGNLQVGENHWTLFIALIFASDIRKIGYVEHY